MKVQPWNMVFIFGFIAYVVIRGIFERRIKTNVTIVRHVDWQERFLLLIMFVGGLLLPIIYLTTPLLKFADYRLPQIVSWIGVVLMMAALWLFWRSHVDLGQNWSRTLELREEHHLVMHGLYRSIRHPMYAAIWLFSLAQGLLLSNWFAGWSAFVAFAILYVVRTPNEERMMSEYFGQEYRDYMKRTGRIFPRFRG